MFKLNYCNYCLQIFLMCYIFGNETQIQSIRLFLVNTAVIQFFALIQLYDISLPCNLLLDFNFIFCLLCVYIFFFGKLYFLNLFFLGNFFNLFFCWYSTLGYCSLLLTQTFLCNFSFFYTLKFKTHLSLH